MSDLGSRLKSAREERGMSLQDVAATTKISVVALEALEREDYGRVPGGIFGRAFVRGYASAVGLDPETAVGEFLAERTRREQEAEKIVKHPETTADDRLFLGRQQRAVRLLRGGLVAAAVLAVATLVYEVYVWWPRAPATAVVTPSPESPAPASEQAAPPVQADPAADVLVVEFTVTTDSWLRLAADGAVVLDRQLKAGERQTVKAARDLQIQSGNGGGFAWTINGQPAKPLGELGTTARASLTRQNWKMFLK